jgi:antibiotic biosynthesis monooxygenase (ABM) superfamily enzyme
VTAHSFSWQMALFTMAACYGATLIQVEGIAPVLARGAVLVTILFGAISGLSLLV